MLADARIELGLRPDLLVSPLPPLFCIGELFLDSLEILEDEFGLDDFDVASRIDLSVHVDDVFIFEASYDVADGVHLPDVRQKLIAEPLTLACAFDKACDI